MKTKHTSKIFNAVVQTFNRAMLHKGLLLILQNSEG